ncbi:MAG: type 1 periplasmic binding fold superfamily protein [Deltaproteobacteria bacterium]|nr:type 1 periplasmic binding fold superfamily protein [Deltaproteobacteria bacterium]
MTTLLAGCEDPTDPGDQNEQELITTVELTLTPDGGGDDVVARWADPEGDGSPVIDDVLLDAGGYTLAVRFLDELSSPVEDISEEVAAEADEHQVFFTGPGVEGPASTAEAATVLTHAYTDTDDNGLPLGLENSVDAVAGTTELTVTLRHLPMQGDVAQKTEGIAGTVAEAGIGAIAGDTDAEVTFSVDVQ